MRYRESWDAERDTLSDLKKHFQALTSELGDKIREFRGLAAEKIAEVFHSFDSEMAKVTEHLGRDPCGAARDYGGVPRHRASPGRCHEQPGGGEQGTARLAYAGIRKVRAGDWER